MKYEGEIIFKKFVEDVVILRIKLNKEIDFKPGQFIRVFVPKNSNLVSKPYSISSKPSIKDYIELCIKVVENGYVSNYMARLNLKDKILIDGPYGNFFLKSLDTNFIFLATGTGISSIKPMIEYLIEKGVKKEVYLFFGVRKESNILYKDIFEKFEKENDNFHFIVCLSRPEKEWKGEKGYVQDIFKSYVEKGRIRNLKEYSAYICGVLQAVKDGIKVCRDLGIERIYFEGYV